MMSRRPQQEGTVLVDRLPLEAVDDDHFDRAAAGLQLQPELLLHRREDVRRVGIRGSSR